VTPAHSRALAAAIFALFPGAWAAISLVTGKFYNPKYGWFGELVDRRKEPASYWFFVALTGGAALLCIGIAVTLAISN
jgi:hypothetical protein